MDRLPVMLDLRDRPVLLVGEGPAAEAKARLLVAAGAVPVAARSPGVRIAVIALEGKAAEAEAHALRAAGLLVNVVDRPDLCDFTMPAIVDRSPVVVAIGTAGTSATLAKALRERIEALLPATLGSVALAVRSARDGVATRLAAPAERRRFWDGLMAPGAPLDPLAPAADPGAAIDAALADGGRASPAPRLDRFAAGPDPDDLTLRQLRLLSQADTVFHTPAVAPAVLDRARRDAARFVCAAAPEPLPPGRSVFVEAA